MALVPPKQVALRDGLSLLVRSLEENDAAAALAHARAVAGESNYLLTTAEEFAPISEPEERAWISDHRERATDLALGAFAGSSLIGLLDFHTSHRYRAAHRGDLGMSVRASYWGRGVGAMLLETLITWARGHEAIQLLCLCAFASNERAIRLYQRFGFQQDGRRQRAYRISDNHYDDEILMSLAV